MYTVIDTASWNRKDTYHFFKDFDDPFFNVVVHIDISRLYAYCNEFDLSFFLSLLYLSQEAAHKVPAFRLRFLADQVVEFDTVNCGSTVLHEDDTFTFCYFEQKESLQAFVKAGTQRLADHLKQPLFDPRNDEVDVIHYSVLPWISFTGLKHARRFRTGDSVPKITFGKYFWEGEVLKIPVSVEVNHALVDGVQVGHYLKFFEDRVRDLASSEP